MEKLFALVKKLRTAEIRMLRRFLLSRLPEGVPEKRVQLFDCVAAAPAVPDEQEIARKLGYKSKSDKAYINLRSRLREDILDMMLIQENGKAFENNYAQAQFECRKRLMQGEMLLARGCYDPALELLGDAIHLAHRFELHAELILMTDLLRSHAIVRNDMDVYNELNDLLHEAQTGLSASLRARQLYFEITVPGLLQVDSLKGYRKHAGGLLVWLDNKTKRSYSPRIAFFRGLAQVNFHTTLYEFSEAITAGKKLLQLIEHEEVLRCDPNRGGITAELAALALRAGRYEEAENYVRQSASCFAAGLLNHFRVSQLHFFILLRSGKMDEAAELLNKLEMQLVECDTALHRQHLHFFQAVLRFHNGKGASCAAQLKKCRDLASGNSEWTPGYLLFELMLSLDAGDYDTLQKKIMACRKKAAFAGYTRRMHARFFLIIDLLMWISRREDVKLVFEQKKEELALLERGEGEYHWNPGGYEVIRFDEWLRKKVSGSPAKPA